MCHAGSVNFTATKEEESVNKISAINAAVKTFAIDLAKLKLQVHGYDHAGQRCFAKALSRIQTTALFLDLGRPVKVVMEACSSGHYWGRQLLALGHEVALIPPQFVKPLRIGNKTDGNDADAIYEASLRPKCRPVPVKAIEQQDLMLTQLERDRLIKQRTALTNQMRGVLAERGLVFGKGLKALSEGLREVLARSPDEEVTARCLEWLQTQLTDWQRLDERLKDCERRMNRDFRSHPRCQPLKEADGIGVQTALCFLALVGDGSQFASGRALGAWVGLTPLEASSGERRFLGAITKRGDSTLRWLLVNGGRTLAAQAKRKAKNGLPLNERDTWLLGLIQRAGFNKAAVAMANKNARILWAMLRNGEAFRSPLMAA